MTKMRNLKKEREKETGGNKREKKQSSARDSFVCGRNAGREGGRRARPGRGALRRSGMRFNARAEQ